MQHAVRGGDLVGQLVAALVHCVEAPHVLEVVYDGAELFTQLPELLRRLRETVLRYVDDLF